MDAISLRTPVSGPAPPHLTGIRRTQRLSWRRLPRAELGGRLSSSKIVTYTLATPAELSAHKRVSALERGGPLPGREAAGKVPAQGALGAPEIVVAAGGKFSDPRWKNGTWDLTQFSNGTDGNVDWDAVIDAEVTRRQWVEETSMAPPIEDNIALDTTATLPWWAQIRSFHLPEAEKLNGRAAMVGFVTAYVIDAATGAGLVDQLGGLLGKLMLLVTVSGVLLLRDNSDIEALKYRLEEFFDW